MSIPAPKPGLIIRYSFLGSAEAKRGAVEGSKDRPCAIVVAARNEAGEIRTIVAPITHSPPIDVAASLEITPELCRTLGLDAGRHWIRLDELNRFVWPGYDLRPRPDGRYDYGMLPPGLFEQLKRRILEIQKARKGRVVERG